MINTFCRTIKLKFYKMKKLFMSMIMLLIGMSLFSQPEKGKLIPVTTNSKTALSYYNQAMKYFDDVKLKKALETFKKALDEDQDFFMADYQLAFYFILN